MRGIQKTGWHFLFLIDMTTSIPQRWTLQIDSGRHRRHLIFALFGYIIRE
jgi:hypothetical protein